jgi:serine/threonine-protein kinase
MADALQYAHDLGVTHRDVKPANIMLDSRGNAMLTDFGIARVAAVPRLTQDGLVIGTPIYMSPEQLRGEAASGAADQYSLGVLAYEMLTGTPPFSGSHLELATAHLTRDPQPLLALRHDCPSALARTVMRMLEKIASARWPSLDAVTEQLALDAPSQTTGWRYQMVALVTTAMPSASAVPVESAAPRSATAYASADVVPPSIEPVVRRWWKGRRSRVGFLSSFVGIGAVVAMSASRASESPVCNASGQTVCPDTAKPEPRRDEPRRDTVRTGHGDSVRFALDRDSLRMMEGDSVTLRAAALGHGDTVTAAVTWVSSDPSIVSVSKGGTVKARAAGGPVSVTAVRGTDSVSARVWVERDSVVRVRLDVQPRTVTVGDTIHVNARAFGRRDTALPNVLLQLTVLDTTIATAITPDRLVAKAPGDAVVAVTAGSVSAHVRLTVAAPRIVPPPDTARVVTDIASILTAVSARDTSRLNAAYPGGEADAQWQLFLRWVMSARDPEAQLTAAVVPSTGGAVSARVEITVVLRWKTRLRRQQKYVAFVAEYVFAEGWRLTSIRPASALP